MDMFLVGDSLALASVAELTLLTVLITGESLTSTNYLIVMYSVEPLGFGVLPAADLQLLV